MGCFQVQEQKKKLNVKWLKQQGRLSLDRAVVRGRE